MNTDKPKSNQARCSNCGKPRARKFLRPAPNGGAICIDWFACQQRRDAQSEQTRSRHRQIVRKLHAV